jgi:signal recognition particle receptor subunit beta
MVVINYATREVSCKIVFYGPGLSGKTTNLQYIHGKVPSKTRGDLISLATDADRTLYFDFLPINIGDINGFTTKFQLYTVPGQVFYNATRKLVLRGVDGIVFVADSQRAKSDENIESLNNLKENLAEYGVDLKTIPFVLQYNKRDLPEVMTIAEMNALLNDGNWTVFEACANKGTGVFDTLKYVIKIVLEKAKKSSATKGTESNPMVEDAQLRSGSASSLERRDAISRDVSGVEQQGELVGPSESDIRIAARTATNDRLAALAESSIGSPHKTSAAEAPSVLAVVEEPVELEDVSSRTPVVTEEDLERGAEQITSVGRQGKATPDVDTAALADADTRYLGNRAPKQEDDSPDMVDPGERDAFSVPSMQESLRKKPKKSTGFSLFRWLFRRG